MVVCLFGGSLVSGIGFFFVLSCQMAGVINSCPSVDSLLLGMGFFFVLSCLGLTYLGLPRLSRRADRLGRPPSGRPSFGGGASVLRFSCQPFLGGGGGGGAETQHLFGRYGGGVGGAVPSVSERAGRPSVVRSSLAGGGLECDCCLARERGALCLFCDKLRPLCGPKFTSGFGRIYLGPVGARCGGGAAAGR